VANVGGPVRSELGRMVRSTSLIQQREGRHPSSLDEVRRPPPGQEAEELSYAHQPQFPNAACSNGLWFVNATLQLQQRNAGSHHLESIRGAVLGGMATDDLRSLQGDGAIPMGEVGFRSLI